MRNCTLELLPVDWPKDSPQLLAKIRKGDWERWGRAI